MLVESLKQVASIPVRREWTGVLEEQEVNLT